jgi:hypothetical protein
MQIKTTYKGLTGKELLSYVSDNGSAVNVQGMALVIIPRTLPFANQAVIATNDEATHVSVQGRFDNKAVLVRI